MRSNFISCTDWSRDTNRIHKHLFTLIGVWAALSAAAVGPTNSIIVSPLTAARVGAASDPVVIVNWGGGIAPYQVQYATDPSTTNWQDSDVVTSNTSQTAIMSSSSGFYRVESMASALAAGKDKAAPSVPTGLSARAVSSGQVDLSWNASTDSGANATGVKGYNVYRNTIFLRQVPAPATSTSDTGLNPATTYSYAVSAVDNASNASGRSGTVSATTPALSGCTFTIAPTNAASAAAGGNGSVSVTASGTTCSWTASSGASWITLTAGGSGTGSGTVGYSVAANTSTTARTGTMTVAGKTFTVTQSGQSAGPANNDFANATVLTGTSGTTTGSNAGATREAGEPYFAGNAGGASVWWSWTAPSSGTVTISLAGSGFDTVLGVYTGSSVSALTLVSQNDDSSGLQSAVTFAATAGTNYRIGVDGYNGVTGSISLSVSLAGTCAYSISPANTSVSAAGSTGSLNVTAGTGCSWTASSGATWITITAGVFGSGNGTVSYSIDANPATSARAGTLTVAGQTFTVNQAAAPCSYSISPGSASFTASTGNGSVAVTAGAGCSWTASSGASWINITAGPSGNGNGSVSYSVAANSSTSSRSGNLTIAGYGFTVTQAGAQATDSTPPTVSLTAPANGSTVSGTITLSASATDNVGVAKVEFYCDGALLGTSVAAPFNMAQDTTRLSNGSHSMTAKAYDGAGNASTSTGTSVNVSNSALPLTGTCIWARHFGGVIVGADGATTAAIKEDKNGNVIAVGTFKGTVNFGGGSVASDGGQDAFIVKYDSSGSYVWGRTIHGAGNEYATGVGLDSAGNLIVVGNFGGTANFLGVSLTAGSQGDVFVMKLSAAGTLAWVKSFGGSAAETVNGVALDQANNIFLTGGYGFYGSAIDFGGGPLRLSAGTSAYQYDMYVAKLSADGNYLWANGYGGLGYDVGNAVAVDANGDVLVVGSFQQTASFGGSQFTSSGGYDLLLAKYSGVNGSHIWSRSGGGTGNDLGRAVTVDVDGNVLIAGDFMGSANFGGGTITSLYSSGMLVAKYLPSGSHVWSRGFSALASFGSASGKSLAADSSGNIVVSGTVSGSVAFDGTYLGFGSPDIVVAKLDGNGGTIWAKSYGDMQSDYGFAVATGAGNNILVGGSFAISADFGCGLMQSSAPGDLSGDGFVVKLAP
jgi:hypothetical protein